jgi:low affinity Fe/Cu permease
MREKFRSFASKTAEAMGTPFAFAGAILVILVWAFSGPAFHYSDTWQLVINTSTTIVTFLMVFLIQNSQNRDTKAIQLKLNELIRSVKGARNELVDLEEMSDVEIEKLRNEFHGMYQKLHTTARARGLSDQAETHSD